MKPSDLNTRPRRHGKNSDIIEQQRARIADLEVVTEAQAGEIARLRAAVDWWKSQMTRTASLAKRNEANVLYAECEYCGATADVPANIQHTHDCYISEIERSFERTQRQEADHDDR